MKPPKELPEPYERARLQSLRSQLTYSEEQLAIFKRKAEAEEMRANKLLAAHETLKAQHDRTLELLGTEFGKVELREAALVQLALRIAPYGDPVAPELGLVASVAPGRG